MKSFFLALPLIACCSTAFAQGPAAQASVDRAISATQPGSLNFRSKMQGSLIRDVNAEQAPELYPGELQDVGPQFLVERKGPAAPERKIFEGFFDSQFFYTSNALLTEKGNQDTGVMVLTLQAAFNLPQFEIFGNTASPRIGYRHQWWLYSLTNSSNQLNNFDFAVATLFVGMQQTWGESWVTTLGVDYNRFLSADHDWNEFYTEALPNWSLEKNVSFGDKSQLTIGYYGGIHFTYTDPQPSNNIDDRLDSTLGLTYTRELLPNLFLQANYRLQWSHYTENHDRNDMYNNAALGFVYLFSDWASLRTFVTFENRNSSDDTVADYTKWDSGVGLNFSARF